MATQLIGYIAPDYPPRHSYVTFRVTKLAEGDRILELKRYINRDGRELNS